MFVAWFGLVWFGLVKAQKLLILWFELTTFSFSGVNIIVKLYYCPYLRYI